MTESRFQDMAELTGVKLVDGGSKLVADAFVARSGVQLYAGREVGNPEIDVVRVFRPEAEVRAADSMRTWSHATITLGHPKEPVTAGNWKDLAIGEVSTDAEWVDGKLRMPLAIKDGAAMREICDGTRGLSAGYTCELEWADGVTPDGEAFDAVQRNIRINHLAVVPQGRAGHEFRIGDGADKWGAAPKPSKPVKEVGMSDALMTVVLGDKAAQVAVADAPHIEKFKADQEKAFADAKAKHEAEIATKDEEIGKLKANLKAAEDAATKPEDLDKMVADRAELVTVVKAIDATIDPAGLSDADLRRKAVAVRFGDAEVKEVSDAEVSGMFRALQKGVAKADTLADFAASAPRPTSGNVWADAAKSVGIKMKKEA